MTSDDYSALFASYVVELTAARETALAWWDRMTADEQRRGLDAAAARNAVVRRWPCGPASHPRVLAVYRKYFLACEALNRSHSDSASPESGSEGGEWGSNTEDERADARREVPPNVFAVDWLAGKYPDLENLLAGLLLSPIGMDERGAFG